MTRSDLRTALAAATEAAQQAGALMRRNLRSIKVVGEATRHDIKLELDVRCQRLIERTLARATPTIPVLGEEGDQSGEDHRRRWVVDPIDGTVNYAHGIPHACVSIALQERERTNTPFRTRVGVVYDPFCEELWTAQEGRPARLNGKPITVSRRPLSEAVVSLGFGKSAEVLEYLVPALTDLANRVRKIRIMGAAALGLCYVASGRFDAFVEPGLRLWDIAAGGFILEQAGGTFWRRQLKGHERYAVNAHNGRLARSLSPYLKPLILETADERG
jgi:myo-inositol-1(or 4)-monophosphatase